MEKKRIKENPNQKRRGDDRKDIIQKKRNRENIYRMIKIRNKRLGNNDKKINKIQSELGHNVMNHRRYSICK